MGGGEGGKPARPHVLPTTRAVSHGDARGQGRYVVHADAEKYSLNRQCQYSSMYTLSQKNDTDVAHYNNARQPNSLI